MIVDDNQNFRKVLSEILLVRFPVTVKERSAKGRGPLFRSMNRFRPDMVFVDMQSVGPDCGWLITRAKESRRNLSFIMLVNYELEEYWQHARACGADFCLSKGSCTPEEIAGLVGLIIDSSDLSFPGPGAILFPNRLDIRGK